MTDPVGSATTIRSAAEVFDDHLRRALAGDTRAMGSDVQVEDGADAFVIRDGLIRMQAIHYTVRHRTGYHRRIAHGARRSEGG
ncbi:MAG TPA: hypothetical protein VHR55_10195 [Candidatus Limnocylindria bacterium]|nr:hypothetical protein [Candidatus Limnocylindria bacterium]